MAKKELRFIASREETEEKEFVSEDYGGRFFKYLLNQKINPLIQARVFIERFKPGAESNPHYHQDGGNEIFFGLKGTGICELSHRGEPRIEKKYVIKPGTVVYCPGLWTHKIRNASDTEEWEVLGVVFPETGLTITKTS